MATNRLDTLDPALITTTWSARLENRVPSTRSTTKKATITDKMNLSDKVDIEDCILSFNLCVCLCNRVFNKIFSSDQIGSGQAMGEPLQF